MIIAHIWEFRGVRTAWGHAAVEIRREGASDCYISWWPGHLRQPKYPGLAGKTYTAPLFSGLYSAPANRNQTFAADVSGEEGMQPDHSLEVLGLDPAKIKAWWDGFLVNPPDWSSLDVNCAMVAAYALRAGGANDVISGVSGWWRSWNTVWSPNDVILLVEAINRGAVSAGK